MPNYYKGWSLVLYSLNLYMPDMQTPSKCKYADDTVLCYITKVSKRKNLNELCDYFKSWKMKINPNNTKAILAYKKKKRQVEKLKINNPTIQ